MSHVKIIRRKAGRTKPTEEFKTFCRLLEIFDDDGADVVRLLEKASAA